MGWATLTASKTTNGSLAQWLNDTNIQGVAATIIGEAESWIYRRLRVRQMIPAPVTGKMVVGTATVTLPTDYLQMIRFQITGNSLSGPMVLDKKTLHEVWGMYNWDSTGTRVNQAPVAYYTDTATLYFDSPPDQTYAYMYDYYQQPTALGSGNDTNFVTDRAPRLLRCVCMALGAEFLKDSGQGQIDRTYWLEQAEAELVSFQAENDSEHTVDVSGPVFT